MHYFALAHAATVACVVLSACGNGDTDALPGPDPAEQSGETIDLNSESAVAEWNASMTAECETATDTEKCAASAFEGTTVTMSGSVVLAMDVEGHKIISVRNDNPQLKIMGVGEGSEIQYGWDFACPAEVAGCAEVAKGDNVSLVATYEYYQYPGMDEGIDLRIKELS